MKKVPKKKDSPSYKITLDMQGDVRVSEGATIDEALNGFGIDYTQVKTKGTIILEHAGKSATRFFYLPQLRRLVANKIRKAQVGRDLVKLLK